MRKILVFVIMLLSIASISYGFGSLLISDTEPVATPAGLTAGRSIGADDPNGINIGAWESE
jgi:hypothetical protein